MTNGGGIRSRIHVFLIQETGRTRAFPRMGDELRIYLVSSATSPKAPMFGGQRQAPRHSADGASSTIQSRKPAPA